MFDDDDLDLPPALTNAEMDNLQRMLDPVNPMDFMFDEVRDDWLMLCANHHCDLAA